MAKSHFGKCFEQTTTNVNGITILYHSFLFSISSFLGQQFWTHLNRGCANTVYLLSIFGGKKDEIQFDLVKVKVSN